MLERTDTEEMLYKFREKREEEKIEENEKRDCYELLGMICGKSIFERMPINCYLNRTLVKHIIGLPVLLSDIIFYDKQVTLL